MVKVGSIQELRQRMNEIPLVQLSGSDIGYFMEADAHIRRAQENPASSKGERAFYYLCAEPLIAAIEMGRKRVREMVEEAALHCN